MTHSGRWHSLPRYLSLFISLIICSLFGWTGALVRVSALSYFQSIKFIQSQYFIFFKLFPFLTSKIFHKIFVLFLISSSFGNVFINFSFLLSAIGAIILEISSYITNFLISNLKIFKAICNTILTSFFTGIILYPFTNIDLINSKFKLLNDKEKSDVHLIFIKFLE